jgi:hypothetical protein
VDSAWEQEKLEARKILLEAADSQKSATRFVGRFLTYKIHCCNHTAKHRMPELIGNCV